MVPVNSDFHGTDMFIPLTNFPKTTGSRSEFLVTLTQLHCMLTVSGLKDWHLTTKTASTSSKPCFSHSRLPEIRKTA